MSFLKFCQEKIYQGKIYISLFSDGSLKFLKREKIAKRKEKTRYKKNSSIIFTVKTKIFFSVRASGRWQKLSHLAGVNVW